MQITQKVCEEGHYYDESYGSCPICNNGTGKKSTVLLEIGSSSHKPKTPQVEQPDTKTVYIGKTKEVDIKATKEVTLAGWVVITSENGKGSHYLVTFGFNSIGRGDTNHIALTHEDNTISREKHASIIYDYTNNVFFLKHEDGKYLTYLNGSVVLETKELKAFDRIKIGNTELIFIALCGEHFKWEV